MKLYFSIFKIFNSGFRGLGMVTRKNHGATRERKNPLDDFTIKGVSIRPDNYRMIFASTFLFGSAK